MNKLDTLDRGIAELRKLLSRGWQDIAAGHLTPQERCLIRNRMIRAAADLRRCLKAREHELRRLQNLSRKAIAGVQSVELRFLNTDYDVTVAPLMPSNPAAPIASQRA